MTTELRGLLEKQHAERERLNKRGVMSGFGSDPVFFRMVAEERGGDKKPPRIKSHRAKPLHVGSRLYEDLMRIADELDSYGVFPFVRESQPLKPLDTARAGQDHRRRSRPDRQLRPIGASRSCR